ncbi:alpha/beta hydrolase [Mucilaginibacter sp. PAMC 26640]|nr:alpha/beta hydrolase [Mucilaginibacter sp. PAMC 26640]
MKKLKQIITRVKEVNENGGPDLDLLWQLICYSPKMPTRLQQQNLLDESLKFSLEAFDDFFTKGNLVFNGFKWGVGSRLIMITHGWGSKAADFAELITALRELPDTSIIAFDAPGSGSSEGELSNGELFAKAALAVIEKYGTPDVMIGHSLGGMANIMALSRLTTLPKLLISIAPLIRLKENFEASMNAAGVSRAAQEEYFESFEHRVGRPALHYDIDKLYKFGPELKHLVLYDEADLISPCDFVSEFLSKRPFIKSKEYTGAGHERIIKLPEVISDIVEAVTQFLI